MSELVVKMVARMVEFLPDIVIVSVLGLVVDEDDLIGNVVAVVVSDVKVVVDLNGIVGALVVIGLNVVVDLVGIVAAVVVTCLNVVVELIAIVFASVSLMTYT